MKKLMGMELFFPVTDRQEFFNVKINYNLPVTEVVFESKDLIIALQITALKFLGGYNSCDDVEIIINNIKIDNEYLYFWNDKNKFIMFTEKTQKIIKHYSINTITVKFIDSWNFEYSKHIIIYEDEKNIN